MKKMKMFYWLLLAMLLPATAEAANLSIEQPFTISAGEEKQMVIDLSNSNMQVTLVQFDLRLPTGLSLKQVDGDYDIDIAGRTTWKKHSLQCNATDGILRFLLASQSNDVLTGTSGAIINMTLQANSSFSGGTICLENILLVSPDEKESKPSDVTLTIPGPSPSPKLVLSASPSGGQVSAGTKVTLTAKADGSTVSGCDIYYTLNGDKPTKSSTKYTSLGITINSGCTLKAIAYKSGYEDSEVLTETYSTKDKKKLVVVASPSGGEVAKGASVELFVRDKNGNDLPGDIYYTLNGSTPSMSSTKYNSGGITINSDCTLKAIAYCDGYETSDVLTATYTIKPEPTAKAVAVSAGDSHSMALMDDGSVWTWGDNGCGQLGDGSNKGSLIPKKVLDGGVAVSVGGSTSFVIKKDGTLWACGKNDKGQLGDGTNENRNEFVIITTNVVAVSSGTDHTLILKDDGTLWACGGNSSNQLGDYTKVDRKTPIKVMENVKDISAGEECSLAIKTDGTLWQWGIYIHEVINHNYNGWRGSEPQKIADNVEKAFLGGVFSGMSSLDLYCLIIKKDGSLWAYGDNYATLLGDAASNYKDEPAEAMEGVSSVAAGFGHSLIIKKDKSLWTCGNNKYGQLGDNATSNRLTPVNIMNNVAAVAASNYVYSYSMIVKTDGTVWTCGYNESGQLGDGTTTNRNKPVQVNFGDNNVLPKLSLSSSPTGGQVSAGTRVYLTAQADGSTVSGCDIYYTTNGNTPSKSYGTKYTSSGIAITSNCTLKAIAYKDGYETSEVLTATYTVKPAPKLQLTASPSSGEVDKNTKVTLTAKADGSTVYGCDIYYTTNGNTPTKYSTKYTSSGITINSDCTLKAIAYMDGYETSDVLTVTYTVKPDPKLVLSASPSSGKLTKGSTVILNVKADGNTVSGCDIYYTLNGSTPSTSSTKYTSAGIAINEAGTLKAVAYKGGYETSDVLTEVYTIKYDDIRLSIASAGYATFYSSESAYKLPSGLSAKVVKGAGNGKLTYETIIIIDGSNTNIVPKGVPVMIENSTKQAGTYTLTAVESDATYTGTNLLRGSDEAMTTTGDGYHYKLSYGPSGTKWNDVFGWYWGAKNGGEFQIEGHKAWLVVPRNGTRAAGFNIEGESLDIETIDHSPSTTDYYYDLQGRRITDMKDAMPSKKGVYIRNGQKVVVK